MNERDRYLTEAMGKCWHESDVDDIYDYTCKHCNLSTYADDGKSWYSIESARMDFSTWQGFGELWEWATKQEWWDEFKIHGQAGWQKAVFTVYLNVPAINRTLINPNKFADALYKYLNNVQQ